MNAFSLSGEESLDGLRWIKVLGTSHLRRIREAPVADLHSPAS